ncbi:MAG: HAD family phosphatase [Treponema sp.]|jgi:HAD superfamily hydrolase (TIGR01509 family)|nr:HAD family phosphatase [Treponema sp.]
MINQQFVPQAVLFDMDGLMLDTEGPVLPFWYEIMEKYAYPLDEETLFRTIGVPAYTTEKILKEKYGTDFPYDKITEELVKMVQDDNEKNGIPQKQGLITLLDHLDNMGIPKAVATSTEREKALWKLKHAGIFNRFSVIVTVNDVKHGKPAPDLFLAAAEKLGKAPELCIGFEDSTAGLQSLAAAGVKSVFIKDILTPPEDVLKTVWRQFSNLAEAVELFR